MYNFIINPKTNRKVSIFSKLGKKILFNYFNQSFIGGASSTEKIIVPKIIEIHPKQIRLTKPIKNAISKYLRGLAKNDENFFDEYLELTGKKAAPAPLNRMERMMEANYDELINQDPIEVSFVLNENRKKVAHPLFKINGKRVPIYDIINGRHRLVRAIIDNKPIKALIK